MPNDAVRKVDYWYATVDDRPGEAGKVLEKVAAAKVNLLAFLAFPAGGGKSQVDLIPADPTAFEKAAKAAGIALSAKKRALLLTGADRVGAVAEATKRLAAKGINVTAATAVATQGGGYGLLIWVRQNQVDAAATALGA
jgi:hypothetical protein